MKDFLDNFLTNKRVCAFHVLAFWYFVIMLLTSCSAYNEYACAAYQCVDVEVTD